jgi:signal transduction histidine kinase
MLAESQRLGIRWATTVPIADRVGLLGVLAISTSSQPDTDELGLLQIVCNQISVSMRKILFEDELIGARNELELYVDIMGHDITNSIQIALGYLEMLRQPAAVEKGYATCAINALLKINTLIGSVRKIRKVRLVTVGPVKVKPAVDAAVHDVRCITDLMDKDVEVRSDVDPVITVKANALLKDVVYNVLESIVYRIASGGVIQVSAAVEGEECTLIIEDTGPGMEAEARSVFTDAGMMGDRIRRMNMGLYFVKSALKSYEGAIRVEDRVPGSIEKGDRFSIKLKSSPA